MVVTWWIVGFLCSGAVMRWLLSVEYVKKVYLFSKLAYNLERGSIRGTPTTFTAGNIYI